MSGRHNTLVLWFMLMTTGHAPAGYGDDWQQKIELGIGPGVDALTLRVISSGCTKKEHFEFSVDNGKSTVSVRRITKDRCRARPRPVEITYTWEEIGVSSPIFFDLRPPSPREAVREMR